MKLSPNVHQHFDFAVFSEERQVVMSSDNYGGGQGQKGEGKLSKWLSKGNGGR